MKQAFKDFPFGAMAYLVLVGLLACIGLLIGWTLADLLRWAWGAL